MNKHTPGPWRQSTALSSDWPFIRYIDDADGNCVAHVRSGMKANDPPVFNQAQALANARLIAEAPALADALRYLLEQTIEQDETYGIELTEGEREAAAQARAILARIDGEG